MALAAQPRALATADRKSVVTSTAGAWADILGAFFAKLDAKHGNGIFEKNSAGAGDDVGADAHGRPLRRKAGTAKRRCQMVQRSGRASKTRQPLPSGLAISLPQPPCRSLKGRSRTRFVSTTSAKRESGSGLRIASFRLRKPALGFEVCGCRAIRTMPSKRHS